jgi:purine-binding chemotaxis protein CheW
MELKNLLLSLQEGKKDNSNQRKKSVEESISLITFRVANKVFAIDINSASEIMKISKLTIVPNSQPYIKGVTNLRGIIIPLYDLKVRFNLEETDENKNDLSKLKGKTAIVINLENISFALIIDEILKTISVPVSSVSLSPELMHSIGNEFIKGVVRQDEKKNNLLMILNLEKLV